MCDSYFEEITERCGPQQRVSYSEPSLQNNFQSDSETISQVFYTQGYKYGETKRLITLAVLFLKTNNSN